MSFEIQNVTLSPQLDVNPVWVKGKGSPLVFLHGLLGQEWTRCLDELSLSHKVYAPANVGSDEPDDLADFDGMHDLVMYYDELFDVLGLQQFDLVGHSFGGMMAAELAAIFPGRVRRLVLIDALGLWRDDLPVGNHVYLTPEAQIATLLGDTGNPDVQRKLMEPDDPKLLIESRLRRITSVASTTHFVWPIPERGLSRRLHRIRAKTLLIWGSEDRFISPEYARDFSRRIKDSRVEYVGGAGHSPHYDQPSSTAALIADFLAN